LRLLIGFSPISRSMSSNDHNRGLRTRLRAHTSLKQPSRASRSRCTRYCVPEDAETPASWETGARPSTKWRGRTESNPPSGQHRGWPHLLAVEPVGHSAPTARPANCPGPLGSKRVPNSPVVGMRTPLRLRPSSQ
jgi:hypothetical protein